MRAYKVLHAPTDVGGNAQVLSRALGAIGVDSVDWVHQQGPFGYHVDRALWADGDGLMRREWRRLMAIAKALRTFDIVNFNFGTCLSSPFAPPPRRPVRTVARFGQPLHRVYLSLLSRVELGLLRWLGKPVFVHYQGDDARQGDVFRKLHGDQVADRINGDYYHPASDAFKRDMIQRMDAACDQIYALNPDLLHVLPARAKFQPYANVWLPDWAPAYTQSDTSRPLRIGHAPTNRRVKGTDLVEQAVASLQAEGHRCELVLVEGMTNVEARKQYESVDVLVDQLFYGWYGGLAVEAMALGKPVLVYLREDDLKFIPPAMRDELPFIRTTARTIEHDLRTVLTMPRSEVVELARRSRAFVERWHDPRRIAAELKADYEEALRKRGRL